MSQALDVAAVGPAVSLVAQVPDQRGMQRVAAVATRSAALFGDVRRTLRAVGFGRVVHVTPQGLLDAPDAFWVVDARMAGGISLAKQLVASGRNRGLLLANKSTMLDNVALIRSGVPAMLIVPLVVAPTAAESVRRLPVSDRELAVIRLAAAGLTNALIAAELTISPLTVKSHLQRIQRKLHADNRAHVVAIAMRDGLIA